jgi:hypothetical protein
MPTIIDIDATDIRKNQKPVIALKDLDKHVTTVSSGGILPQNCRFAFRNGRDHVFVMEYAPSTRRIVYRDTPFTVRLPYLIMVVSFFGDIYFGGHTVHIYFRNEPLKTIDDRLYLTCFPNCRADGCHCMGAVDEHDWVDYRKYSRNEVISRRLADVIRHFWQARFNDDLGAIRQGSYGSYDAMTGNSLKNHLARWERIKMDPTKRKWPQPIGYTSLRAFFPTLNVSHFKVAAKRIVTNAKRQATRIQNAGTVKTGKAAVQNKPSTGRKRRNV